MEQGQLTTLPCKGQDHCSLNRQHEADLIKRLSPSLAPNPKLWNHQGGTLAGDLEHMMSFLYDGSLPNKWSKGPSPAWDLWASQEGMKNLRGNIWTVAKQPSNEVAARETEEEREWEGSPPQTWISDGGGPSSLKEGGEKYSPSSQLPKGLECRVLQRSCQFRSSAGSFSRQSEMMLLHKQGLSARGSAYSACRKGDTLSQMKEKTLPTQSQQHAELCEQFGDTPVTSGQQALFGYFWPQGFSNCSLLFVPSFIEGVGTREAQGYRQLQHSMPRINTLKSSSQRLKKKMRQGTRGTREQEYLPAQRGTVTYGYPAQLNEKGFQKKKTHPKQSNKEKTILLFTILLGIPSAKRAVQGIQRLEFTL